MIADVLGKIWTEHFLTTSQYLTIIHGIYKLEHSHYTVFSVLHLLYSLYIQVLS